MDRIAVRLMIRGRVQGVGYRWWAMRRAAALDLAGWVRNRTDGSVELLAIGDPEALTAMAAACWQGPSAARVTAVTRTPAGDDGSVGFEERGNV